MTVEQKLIEKQEDFIEILLAEIASLSGLAHAHGWKSPHRKGGLKVLKELQGLRKQREEGL